jgi:uncharacterized cupin superfamily protein
MADSRDAVRVWRPADLEYKPIGDTGMRYCNPLDPSLSDCRAGYLEIRGGTLEWTEKGDEIIWVLTGRVTITHGSTVYDLQPGDIIFLRDGIALRMTGSGDARIAWIANLPPKR